MNSQIVFSKNDYSEKGHCIYNGNCIDLLKKLPEATAKLIFADPPYNLQLKQDLYRPNQTKVEGVTDCWDKFNSFKDYDTFTKNWLEACQRVLSDEGTIWVIGSYHNIFRVGKIMLDLGYWILNDIQWHKTNPMPNFRGVRFTNATETLIWAKKSEKQKIYTFNYQTMKQLNNGKQMSSVWQIPLCTGKERIKNEQGKKAHSTQKPEELLKRIILSSSQESDLILDPFLGSGTTSAMAKKLNRKSIGIEKNEDYIKIAVTRLKAIEPTNFVNLRIKEPIKKTLQRVSLQQLIKENYLKENQIIYTANKKHCATILADGRIKNGVGIASIHKIGALLQNKTSCNGWHFWYFEDTDCCKKLDEKRNTYWQKNGI